MSLGDAVRCVRCGTELSPALDGCLTCGQPGPWSADTTGDWSVQLGPITSQKFRDHAVEQLRRLDPHVDGGRVASQLQRGHVRVASNLTQDSADALVRAFGAQETLAKTVSSTSPPPPRSGPNPGAMLLVMAGMVILGSVAVTLITVLGGLIGLAIGVVLLLGLFAAMAVVFGRMIFAGKSAVAGKDLMSLPVAPAVPQGAAGLVHRLHEAAATRGSDQERVLEAGRRALRLLARLADPDDFAARIAGGAEGELGLVAADAARAVVDLAEGEDGPLQGGENAKLTRLIDVVDKASATIDASSGNGTDENDIAQQLEEQVAAVQAQRAQ
jgi:hypothetical protein